MELRLRVAAPDDAELFADLETAAHPDDPSDPVVTRAFLEGGLDDWDVTHLLVLAGERPAGVHVSTGFTGTTRTTGAWASPGP